MTLLKLDLNLLFDTFVNVTYLPIKNSLVSNEIHDQTDEDWKCWGFAMTTTIKSALKNLIKNLIYCDMKKIRNFDSERFQDILRDTIIRIDDRNFHKILRSELMTVVHPIRQNTEDVGQNPLDLITRVSLMSKAISIHKSLFCARLFCN